MLMNPIFDSIKAETVYSDMPFPFFLWVKTQLYSITFSCKKVLDSSKRRWYNFVREHENRRVILFICIRQIIR